MRAFVPGLSWASGKADTLAQERSGTNALTDRPLAGRVGNITSTNG
jgi:hypothetical protein